MISHGNAIPILLVEDNPGDARLVSLYLKGADYYQFELDHVVCLKDAMAAIEKTDYPVILLDLGLPDGSGINSITAITQTCPTAAVIVMTGIYDGALATNAISAGAQDYLVKGEADSIILERTISNALKRVQVSIKLHNAQQQFTAVVESANEAIITIDTDYVICSWNRAATEIFGLDEKSRIGGNVTSIFTHTSQQLIESMFENVIASKDSHALRNSIEMTAQKVCGSSFPVEVSLSTWQVERSNFIGLVIRDITQRRKVEQIKNEFISTVSHELRTPMTSLIGSLKLLSGGVIEGMPKPALELFDVAINNSNRLLLLINDILDVNKIESGELDFQLMAEDISSIAEQALQDNAGYAKKYDVSISLVSNVDHTLIYIDKDRLLQVFANLISNAIKYSPKEGEVVIKITIEHDNVRVSVTDNGPGIPKQFIPKIFQKFAQAESTETRRVGGTGLGLNISKSLVQKMGGTIAFTTESDVATTFYFEFPQYGEQSPLKTARPLQRLGDIS